MDIRLDKGLKLDEDQLRDALKAVGKEFIRECRLLLNQPDNASLPHTDTGQLARSLKMSLKNREGSMWLKITAGTRYATSLFAGSTRHTSHGDVQVRGRPLFDVVMDRMKPRMNKIIREAVQITVNQK